MPLLRQAEKVTIVYVAPESSSAELESGRRVTEMLVRRGARARFEQISTSREEGDALLKKALKDAAGLLVMGAYGHTRIRELVLGGATRSVLSRMHCPVLFSH
jgi:nucleotide-binding universal stress UspA family protein